MDQNELDQLLTLLSRHGVADFTLNEGPEGRSLTVRFAGAQPVGAPVVVERSAAVAVAPAAPAAPVADGRVIKSPIVGTFYRSPAPDKPHYVEVGDRVRKGQVVCIVEAMKLMNQIESDVDGVVDAVLVDNAAPVQFGQELFRIRPA